MTSGETKDLVTQLKSIVAILANAEPEDRKAVYSELNLAIVYHDDGRMQVSAGPDGCTNACVVGDLRRRGDFNPKYTRSLER